MFFFLEWDSFMYSMKICIFLKYVYLQKYFLLKLNVIYQDKLKKIVIVFFYIYYLDCNMSRTLSLSSDK